MEFDIKMKHSQIERLRGELTSAREALAIRASQLEKTEKDLADMRNEIFAEASRRGALYNEIAAAHLELEVQKKLATEADIVAKQADAELEEELEENKKLMDENDDMFNEGEEKDAKIADLERLGEEREADLKSLRQRVAVHAEKRAELAQEVKTLQEQLAVAKAEADQDIGQGADVLLSELHATATVPDMKMASPVQMGDVVALKHPGMSQEANFWLAMVLERNYQKKEVRVMYYEEAGDDGYKAWQSGKHEWVAEKFIAGRIRRIPVTARERQDLQTRLHGGIVAA